MSERARQVSSATSLGVQLTDEGKSLIAYTVRIVMVPGSGVKSILKLYSSKSIVTDGKTTRSKVESIDQKKALK